MKNITDKLLKLENILNNSIEYHKQWNDTKNLIQTTVISLLESCDKMPFEITMTTIKSNKNLETICIYFPKEPFVKIGDMTLVKELGSLYFSQDIDGKIIVFMEYSSVENLKNYEPIELKTFIPNDLTKNIILQLFEKFLDELIKYEETSIKRKIGF